MNILLLNLTRFGDILQTQAAISDMTSSGHTIGVACLENFSEAVGLLDGVTHTFAFPASSLLKSVDKTSNISLWYDALSLLYQWRKDVEQYMIPDVIVNFTPTLSARLLTSFLAKKKPVIGFGLDSEGFGYNSNFWAVLLSGVAGGRENSSFNIVDVFRKVVEPLGKMAVGVGSANLRKPDKQKIKTTKQKLETLAPNDHMGVVAFQLGASDPKRQWPVEYFVELGKILWEKGKLYPVLLGTKQELPLAKEFIARCNYPYLSLIGETNIEGLAEVLCSCSLIITNDTGTMHLAAGLSLPILAIFLATAQPFDTGPYRENCCCLEPDIFCHPCSFGSSCDHDFVCRTTIKPEEVASLALNKIQLKTWTQGEKNTNSRVWETYVDSHGFMSLKSLSHHEKMDRSIWIAWLHCFLRQFLDREKSDTMSYVKEVNLPDLSPFMRESLHKEAGSLCVVLELLEQQGTLLSLKPSQFLRDKFMSTWSLVHRTLQNSSFFASFAYIWLEETQANGRKFNEVLHVIRHFHQIMRFFSTAV